MELVLNTEEEYVHLEAAAATAARRGQKIVFPEPNQLQLDFDTEEQDAIFATRQRFLDQLGVYSVARIPSKSGLPHCHVTLTFEGKEFSTEERIGWQLFLGSDPVREALSLIRAHNGYEQPTLFFENI